MIVVLNEDGEFVSKEIDPLQESPLDKLDLTEKFKPLDHLTCRVCNEDTTLGTYYFKDSGTPYCDYCYYFILGRDEAEEE